MNRIFGFLIMITVSCFSMSAQVQKVEAFVTGLMEQYPKARLLDIYKSCFQDCMGAEHLVADTASARAYLEQEITSTRLEVLMPWYYEPCGLDGHHVRVSLRGVIEGVISADQLLDAFVSSANIDDRPTVEQWAEQWHQIILVIDGMKLSLPNYEQDRQYIDDVLSQGKYAISHSPDYREAYSPHYRIVKREAFEQDILPLLQR